MVQRQTDDTKYQEPERCITMLEEEIEEEEELDEETPDPIG